MPITLTCEIEFVAIFTTVPHLKISEFVEWRKNGKISPAISLIVFAITAILGYTFVQPIEKPVGRIADQK